MPHTHRVLIVEDDADVRSALYELFSADGLEVGTAENGAEAIESLDDDALPCVVVVDLLMPGIVGHELLDYMREDRTLSTIPVAIISGSPQLAPEGYQVFAKPLDTRALRGFVRVACASDHADRADERDSRAALATGSVK